ncbi:ATP-grasp domain-containing protein [Methanoplanus sp. FWC-SCC4]|uniref:ATP-grasp domain-containing protein n=1 Tax=Methanochimaera problematica TaxID=2609417 RepID=A0AA97FBF4_9EURY|nr:ATP-grasp domain-containing protein [Methanoplanus sp. FWC-SCC4]WOF15879.1 ATP-grasp domain-containing protein [Methanoplanus sp. FWC-SCC4]
MNEKVLIAGFATRHVVRSAKNAGYLVYAIDHFCDQDLCRITESHQTFEELAELPSLVESAQKMHNFEAICVTSGAEDLNTEIKITGTPKEIASKFLDKKCIQEFFEEHSIPVPPVALENEYPAMIKPLRGAGGWRNQIVNSMEEELIWRELWPDDLYIKQKVVEGIPCSVSCISNGKCACAISFNEQLLRGGNGERAYGFSGAITPFKHPLKDQIVKTAEKIVSMSGCIGSVGVDFIAGDKEFWAIEINPRFQATMDIVEMSTGINLFKAHINSFNGILPEKMPEPVQYAARRVLFAEKDIKVRDDLKDLFEYISDIPHIGTEIEEGSAILSVYGNGQTREEALMSLDKAIIEIRRYISRW